jgi:hypothetical protein
MPARLGPGFPRPGRRCGAAAPEAALDTACDGRSHTPLGVSSSTKPTQTNPRQRVAGL